LEEKRAHSRRLMHEFASITNSAVTEWTPVILLDVSTNGISFASSEVLFAGVTHPMRFTLPGTPRMHFVSVALLPGTTQGVPVGFRYGAKFVQVHPRTIDQIVQFLSEPV
jgi:hypothetical protein